MDNTNDALANLKNIVGKFTDMPALNLDTYSFAKNIVPSIPTVEIDEESTFAYQMKQQTKQIIEKSNEQIVLLAKQNEQLSNNYQKLEDLYKIKEQELAEAKEEAKKAKRYNILMMIITIVATVVAIASWLLPDFFNLMTNNANV